MSCNRTSIGRKKLIRLKTWPKVLELIELGAQLLFLDEAVFSEKIGQCKIWSMPGSVSPNVLMQIINLKAIAVTAALNFDNEVVAQQITESS